MINIHADFILLEKPLKMNLIHRKMIFLDKSIIIYFSFYSYNEHLLKITLTNRLRQKVKGYLQLCLLTLLKLHPLENKMNQKFKKE